MLLGASKRIRLLQTATKLARPFCASGAVRETIKPSAAKSVATILKHITSHNPPLSRAQLSKIASAVEGKLNSMPLKPKKVPSALKSKVADFYSDKIVWKNGDVTNITVDSDSGVMIAGTTLWETHTFTIGPMTFFESFPETSRMEKSYISGFEELCEEWKSKHNFKTDLEVCTALEWILEELQPDRDRMHADLHSFRLSL